VKPIVAVMEIVGIVEDAGENVVRLAMATGDVVVTTGTGMVVMNTGEDGPEVIGFVKGVPEGVVVTTPGVDLVLVPAVRATGALTSVARVVAQPIIAVAHHRPPTTVAEAAVPKGGEENTKTVVEITKNAVAAMIIARIVVIVRNEATVRREGGEKVTCH